MLAIKCVLNKKVFTNRGVGRIIKLSQSKVLSSMRLIKNLIPRRSRATKKN
jgi:hypothetical protein